MIFPFGYFPTGIESFVQVLLPMLFTPLALGWLGERCESEALVILHLIGVVGLDVPGLSKGIVMQFSMGP